jgi:hypothetical protein
LNPAKRFRVLFQKGKLPFVDRSDEVTARFCLAGRFHLLIISVSHGNLTQIPEAEEPADTSGTVLLYVIDYWLDNERSMVTLFDTVLCSDQLLSSDSHRI